MHEHFYKWIKRKKVKNEEIILPQTNHPTTEQLLDFLRTITFNADYRGYMSAILTRVIAYKDIEKLAIAYKKVLEEK